MMERTIFYSWQNDKEPDTCRYFIRDCIKQSIKRLAKESPLEESPRLDHDTKGVPGTPEIVNTIFNKIENCTIFIADVTFIASSVSPKDPPKYIPNPNVLIELGYAAKVIGWDQIICIMNTSFGDSSELIFDLKHRRRPITYFLDSPNHAEINRIKDELIKSIDVALKEIISNGAFERASILDEFKCESQKARDLVLKGPTNWEYLLAKELLITKMDQVSKRKQEFQKGFLYKKSRKYSMAEYIAWTQERLNDLVRLNGIMMKIINQEIKESFGPPGQPGNPTLIRDWVNKLVEAANWYLDWESERQSAIPDDNLKKLHSMTEGWAISCLQQLDKMVEEFSKITEDTRGEIKINLVFDAPPSLIEFSREIDNLRKQYQA